jgi:hypothetical protein
LLIAERVFDQPSVIKLLDHLLILARSFTPIIDLVDQTFIFLINGEWNPFIFLINGEWSLLRLRLLVPEAGVSFSLVNERKCCFDEREGKFNAI